MAVTVLDSGYLLGDTNVDPPIDGTAGRPLVLILGSKATPSGGWTTPTDSVGNTYTLALSDNTTDAQIRVYTTPQTVKMNGTIALDGDATNPVYWMLVEISDTHTPNVLGATQTGTTFSGTGVATSTLSSARGTLVCAGFFKHGSASTYTADSDTTNGSWSSATKVTNDSGVTALYMQYKDNMTGTSAVTWNPTFTVDSSNHAAAWVQIPRLRPTGVTRQGGRAALQGVNRAGTY